MTISLFESYEEQLSYFTNVTNINLLPMTNGRTVFFKQLGSWFRDYSSESSSDYISYILPNPAQSLSFPTAIDVLSAALAMYQDSDSVDDAIELLMEFGLTPDKAGQPIVSLSGGELLLLNYAKAKAMLPTVNRMVACSPVHWLNINKYYYWDLLVSYYTGNKKNVDVVLLNGEPFPNKDELADSIYWHQEEIKQLHWKLFIDNPKVVFPEIKFPSYHPESSLEFISKYKELSLTSPTLVTGDNGIGKSIFAKVMAGVIKPVDGLVSFLSVNGKGNARLIFQDAIDQVFGMSIDAHLDWIFRFDSTRAKSARSIYSTIEQALRKTLHDNHFAGLSALGVAGKKTTLLQAKICLVAERIASSPPLIVLDEPSWGLSKSVSRIFLTEVCKQAHDNGVAVVIISHQPKWWDGLIQSHIQLTKQDDGKVMLATLEVE